MCDKAANRCFLYLTLFLIGIKLNKYMTVVSEDPFLIIYCSNKYKTQPLCDEAVHDCKAALTFSPDRFVTSKMLEKFDKALLANDDILFFN